MAIPFYNQGDQDIYASGDKYIPQEQYRLGYTAPPSIANAPNTGITNTQAANPYLYPPQGGGGGGGGTGNKFGLNMDTLKTVQQGKWVDGQYVKQNRKIAQTEGGMWKDILTNQNVYHANMPKVKGMLGTAMDKIMGKKTTGDPFKGTWYGSDWDEDEMNIGNRRTVPQNVIQRWMENRDIKKAEVAQEKAATEQAEKTASGVGPTTGQGGAIDPGDVKDIGGGFHEYTDSATAAGYEGTFKKGGRIGYAYGDPVVPEEEDEDIYKFMQDQNIPFSEQVEGDPFQMRIQELMGKGMSWDDAYEIAEMEFQDLFAEGSEQDQGGLASIV